MSAAQKFQETLDKVIATPQNFFSLSSEMQERFYKALSQFIEQDLLDQKRMSIVIEKFATRNLELLQQIVKKELNEKSAQELEKIAKELDITAATFIFNNKHYLRGLILNPDLRHAEYGIFLEIITAALNISADDDFSIILPLLKDKNFSWKANKVYKHALSLIVRKYSKDISFSYIINEIQERNFVETSTVVDGAKMLMKQDDFILYLKDELDLTDWKQTVKNRGFGKSGGKEGKVLPADMQKIFSSVVNFIESNDQEKHILALNFFASDRVPLSDDKVSKALIKLLDTIDYSTKESRIFAFLDLIVKKSYHDNMSSELEAKVHTGVKSLRK